jgi:hypothetical protein
MPTWQLLHRVHAVKQALRTHCAMKGRAEVKKYMAETFTKYCR